MKYGKIIFYDKDYKMQEMKGHLFKRVFDSLLALTGLITSFPLWAVIAYAIYTEDGRPIFFLQKRVGKQGERFKAFKFRTMTNGQVHIDVDLLENDPRVTKVGRLLRALAIDELPQFINIIKGDMSFVGPKPLPFLIEDEEKSRYEYLDEVPGYDERIKVRPGLTGLAQIYAPKNISRRNKFRYDNLYVQKQSFFLDLRLIFQSFFVTFKGQWEKATSVGRRE